MLETIKKNAGGDMGGENFLGTLANGGVALSPFHDLDVRGLRRSSRPRSTSCQADIASGAVKVSDYLK